MVKSPLTKVILDTCSVIRLSSLSGGYRVLKELEGSLWSPRPVVHELAYRGLPGSIEVEYRGKRRALDTSIPRKVSGRVKKYWLRVAGEGEVEIRVLPRPRKKGREQGNLGTIIGRIKRINRKFMDERYFERNGMTGLSNVDEEILGLTYWDAIRRKKLLKITKSKRPGTILVTEDTGMQTVAGVLMMEELGWQGKYSEVPIEAYERVAENNTTLIALPSKKFIAFYKDSFYTLDTKLSEIRKLIRNIRGNV